MKKYNRPYLKYLHIMIAFDLLFLTLNILFRNKYPCTESCIGCGSVVEMIRDTWVSLVTSILLITSLCATIKCFELKEIENNEK